MALHGAALIAMTFNVRYDEEWDGDHCWSNRRAPLVATIAAHAPDVIGLQEAMPHQLAEIAAGLADLTPLDTIFYRSSRFDLRAHGSFTISGDGSRTCEWARILDRMGRHELLFANAHVDTAAAAWLPSAETIAARLAALAREAAVVLVGDFNAAAGSESHRYLLDAGFRDAWYETGHDDENVVTYHGFSAIASLPSGDELERFLEDTSPNDGEFGHYQPHIRRHRNYRIDRILVRGALSCTSAHTDQGALAIQSSDHYPVVASLRWQ